MLFDYNFSKSKHHPYLKFGDRNRKGFEQNFSQLVIDQLLSLLSRGTKVLPKYIKPDILFINS
jgi:hypothetical protein